MNGTAALHLALVLMGVKTDDEVITQGLTFVATANAITYCGAYSVFIDSDPERLGMSADALEKFLTENVEFNVQGFAINRKTKRRIKACVPMHTFGLAVDIYKIKNLCERYKIALIEDAAESLGSYVGDVHTGLIGDLGILSFNGNKIVTTGGGGMIITNNKDLALKAKHLSTTAKVPHQWDFFHDEVGYNYRLPNLNAALGCAQMEMLPNFLKEKREIAQHYEKFFATLKDYQFISEPKGTTSNYWLNSVLFADRKRRDDFLALSQENKIQCRPVWKLMSELPSFAQCQHDGLVVARKIQDQLVNIPSGVRSLPK